MKNKKRKNINKKSSQTQEDYMYLIEDIYTKYCYDTNYLYDYNLYIERFGDIANELIKYLDSEKMIETIYNESVNEKKFKLKFTGFNYISELFIRNRSFFIQAIDYGTTTIILMIANIVLLLDFKYSHLIVCILYIFSIVMFIENFTLTKKAIRSRPKE